MSINLVILKKQIEIFVKDFFVERLLENKKNEESYYLELREYLNQKVNYLKNELGIDFSMQEYREALIEFCMKLGVLDEISSNKEKAMSALVEIINDQSKLSEDIIDRISFHIRQAYKNGLDINKLYAPIYNNNEIKEDTELHKNINEFMAISKSCDMKESIGVFNSFIETVNWPKEKVQKILDETRPNDDNYKSGDKFRQQHNVNFIKHIAKEINKTSLAGDPFNTYYNTIEYNRRKGSEFDHLMYDYTSKTFSICLATKSKNTKIEKNNVFTQPISLLYICNSLITSISGKNRPLTQEGIMEVLKQKLDEQINFRNEILKKGYLTDEEDLSSKNIKGYNKRPNLILKNLIAQGELDPSIIKSHKDIGQVSMIESFAHNDRELIDLLSNNICSFKLDEEHVEQLFSIINSSSEFKVDIYFFGEVTSKRSKQFQYSSTYSDEEIRAAANIFAYAGKVMEGFDGIEITPSGAIKFLEKIKFRFNTSTNQKQNCIDLIKLNENLRDIGGVIINKFMQNENISDVIKLYKNDNGATKGFESLDVLHNVSLFEKNIIGQIIENIEDKKMSPEQSYTYTLSNFNATPKMSLDTFIKYLEEKHILINDEVVSGNLDKLTILKQTVANYGVKKNVLDNAAKICQKLKDKNIDKDDIREILIDLLKDYSFQNIENEVEILLQTNKKTLKSTM
jgi:hypothetical protein